MTIHEAGQRLGLSHTACVKYAQRIGLKPVLRITSRNAYFAYDFTERDLKAIAAERRRRAHAHSEVKAKNMQRVSFQHRKAAIANRDPEEWKRSLAKAVKAAAEMRRRRREWMDKHDGTTYKKPMWEPKSEGWVHPWRAAENANYEAWVQRTRK